MGWTGLVECSAPPMFNVGMGGSVGVAWPSMLPGGSAKNSSVPLYSAACVSAQPQQYDHDFASATAA